MTPIEFAQKYGFSGVNEGSGGCRDIEGAYCCDLLSLVMGRAKENDAFVTVMANVNTIAVAVLADVACVILSEGVAPDEALLSRAREQEVNLLGSGKGTLALAAAVNGLL